MFFESWQSLGSTALSATLAYAAVVVFTRVSGKRTLSKMNAFDLIVTVALGSTLSAIVTSRELPLSNGLLALALLIALQFAIAWLSVRSRWFSHLVTSRPVAVFSAGEFVDEAMQRERLARDEVLMAIRSAGAGDLADVALVVLESDGSLSVLRRSRDTPTRPPLEDVAVES